MHAAARQVVQQLGLLQRPQHRGPAECILDRRKLSKVPEQQKPDPAVRGELGDVGPQPDVELRDLLDHQPVQRAAPRADGPAHPVVRRLRPQPEVLHAAVRLGDQGDPLAELRELRHDLPRHVFPVPGMPDNKRLWPLRQCSTGSSTWRQGSCSVGGSVSSRGSW